MNVLITGGAGYIGTELARLLNNNDDVEKIIIYDNLSNNNYNLFIHSAIPRKKVSFIKGELLDSRKLREVLKNINVVYHLAARVTTPLSNESSHLFEQVNNWGTAELVYAVEESKVEKFIYLSSASIYGASDDFIDINTIPDPKSFYGLSKYRGEQHVSRLIPKLNTFIIRSANVFGYGISMRFDAVINRFMFDACFQKRISIHGDGNQKRTFIHINNVTNFLNKLINNQLESGYYNLSDNILSINEIANNIKEIFPEMEMVFINQHIKIKELKVQPDKRLSHLLNTNSNIKTELIEIKEKFFASKAW